MGAPSNRYIQSTRLTKSKENEETAAIFVVAHVAMECDSVAEHDPCCGEKIITKKRIGEAWMPAQEYGRAMPRFTVNLLVSDLEKSLPFYRHVLGATVRYADSDFGALNLVGLDFMLHADHTSDQHPL